MYYAQSLFLYLIITFISILTCPRKGFWMIYPLRVFILFARLLLQIIKIYYELLSANNFTGKILVAYKN